MNINFNIINELISFLIFFVFSYNFIFSFFLNKINEFNIFEFKNFFYKNYLRTIDNKINNLFLLKENKNIKILTTYLNNLKKKIYFEKESIFKMILFEKKFLTKKIKEKLNEKNLKNVKNFFLNVKIVFLNCIKNLYNNLINYNSEFIINYD